MIYFDKNWDVCKRGSFNQSYNKSYDKKEKCVEGEIGLVGGSYDSSYDESFEHSQRIRSKEVILIPKAYPDNALLIFRLHNIAENINYYFYMEDLNTLQDYFSLKMYNYKDLPTGQYDYTLTGTGGATLSQGIFIMVARKLNVIEEKEEIEFNEYGN